MDGSQTDWLRFAGIALAAVNIGFILGLGKVYYKAVHGGDKSLARPATTLLILAIGLVMVFSASIWKSYELRGTPISAPLLLVTLGYAFTLYGFYRLRKGVMERIEDYGKGRHDTPKDPSSLS